MSLIAYKFTGKELLKVLKIKGKFEEMYISNIGELWVITEVKE